MVFQLHFTDGILNSVVYSLFVSNHFSKYEKIKLTRLMCCRVMMKNFFNPQFGSIFRTCHNPTYFSRRLCCFSDIYMASLSCLLNYDAAFTFYPRRTPLQHEAPLWMDQLCTGCMKTPHLDEMARIRWGPNLLLGLKKCNGTDTGNSGLSLSLMKENSFL